MRAGLPRSARRALSPRRAKRGRAAPTTWAPRARTLPAQRQDGEVVRRFRAGDESADIRLQRFDDAPRSCCAAAQPGQHRLHPLAAVQSASGILRFAHAVGDHAEQLARPHGAAPALVFEVAQRAQRRSVAVVDAAHRRVWLGSIR